MAWWANFLAIANAATQIAANPMTGVLIVVMIAAIIGGNRWHRRRVREGKRGVEPSHLIMIGVVGTFLSSSVGLAGLFWQRYSAPLVGQIDLPNDTARRLVAALQPVKPFLPSVAIAVTNGNDDTERYAYALRDVFHRAGIQTNFGFTIPDGPDDAGVLICIKNPEHPPPEAEILKSALRQAGIETKTRPFTQDGMHVSGQMVLWVAPKHL